MGAASRRDGDGVIRSSFIPHSSQYSLPSMLLVPQLSHLIMRLGLRRPHHPEGCSGSRIILYTFYQYNSKKSGVLI
jgi:hypothetical protein